MGTAGTIVAVGELPHLAGKGLFGIPHHVAPSTPAAAARATPGNSSSTSQGTAAAYSPTMLLGASRPGATGATLWLLSAPLPSAARHRAMAPARPRTVVAIGSSRSTVLGKPMAAPAPAPVEAVPETTAPYLGSAAYGSATESAVGGTRGASQGTATGSGAADTGDPIQTRGQGSASAAPNNGKSRGMKTATASPSGGAGSSSTTAPSIPSGSHGGGASGGGAWSGGSGGANTSPHGR
jgi:hypothetical protein